jgi:hypothetical protein
MPQPSASPARSAAPVTDQRADRRVSLLLRSGKLVSGDAEILCVLRDASSGGIKAKLFHELPDGQQFELELGNGERFPVELIWQSDGHAGFSFAGGPVDLFGVVEEEAAFPKRNLRLKLSMPLTVTIGIEERAATLGDLSQQGAQVQVDPPLAIGQHVRLTAEGFPTLDALVRWRRGKAHGLVFQRSFRLDELAVLVDRLQRGLPESASGQAKRQRFTHSLNL